MRKRRCSAAKSFDLNLWNGDNMSGQAVAGSLLPLKMMPNFAKSIRTLVAVFAGSLLAVSKVGGALRP